jgi:hypothetical protein
MELKRKRVQNLFYKERVGIPLYHRVYSRGRVASSQI